MNRAIRTGPAGFTPGLVLTDSSGNPLPEKRINQELTGTERMYVDENGVLRPMTACGSIPIPEFFETAEAKRIAVDTAMQVSPDCIAAMKAVPVRRRESAPPACVVPARFASEEERTRWLSTQMGLTEECRTRAMAVPIVPSSDQDAINRQCRALIDSLPDAVKRDEARLLSWCRENPECCDLSAVGGIRALRAEAPEQRSSATTVVVLGTVFASILAIIAGIFLGRRP